MFSNVDLKSYCNGLLEQIKNVNVCGRLSRQVNHSQKNNLFQ
jgi:hypothetical protein